MLEYLLIALTALFFFLNYYHFAFILNKVFGLDDDKMERAVLGIFMAVIMVSRLAISPRISSLSYIVFFITTFLMFKAFYRKQESIQLLVSAAYVCLVSISFRTFFTAFFSFLNDYGVHVYMSYWYGLCISTIAAFLILVYTLRVIPDSSWRSLALNQKGIKLARINLFFGLFCIILNAEAYYHTEYSRFLYLNLILFPLFWTLVTSFCFYAMLDSAEKDVENRKIEKGLIYKRSLERQTILLAEFNCNKKTIINYEQNNISLFEDVENIDFESFYNKVFAIVDDDYKKIINNVDCLESLISLYRDGICELNRTVKIKYGDEERWTTFWYSMWEENGDILATLSILDNIHNIKVRELIMKKDAERDLLVGFYNKKTTEYYIQEYLKEKEAAVLFIIDLDNFKAINDNFGHAFGDQVLVEASDKIKTLFRSEDILGRIGGDEFVVLVKDYHSMDTIEQRAQDLAVKIEKVYTKGNIHIALSCSIGIAFSPRHGADFNTLYHNADIAMYSTKNNGKNGYAIYRENMSRDVS